MTEFTHAAIPPEPAMQAMDDSALAARIAGHDMAAFEALMRRHNRAMFRAARSILRDDAAAEDALQEAWLAAYRKIGSFRGEARLSTWLLRIVVNEALMRRRAGARDASVIAFDAGHDEEDGMPATDEPRAQPGVQDPTEREAMRTQVRRLLETKIDALPDAFRSVFVLRAVEEHSVEETAGLLGIPAATVRTRFFRARSLLRESLARDFDLAVGDVFGFDGARCDRIVERVLGALSAASPSSPPDYPGETP